MSKQPGRTVDLLPRMAASLAVLLMFSTSSPGHATVPAADETQQSPAEKPQPPKPRPESPADKTPQPLPVLPTLLQQELRGATALNPESTVFLDPARKRVLLRTEVACTDCILEMVLVPEGNREHETILRIRSKAFVIHSALLAAGLEPGSPAVFSPEFRAPEGPVVDIQVIWMDAAGKRQQRRLQDWVRHNTHRYQAEKLSGPPPGLQLPWKNLRWDRFNNELLWFGPMSSAERDELLGKWQDQAWQQAIRRFYAEGQSRAMKADFVFAGSSMFRDEETGKEFYQAEGGHLICTSNFPDAMLDIREESSASDGAQAYEGWTDRIPPEGTPVLLVIAAAQDKKKQPTE